MSFCGHEIHVGVDCFSVEPLGLRPGGSLFHPLVNLLIRRPSWDSGVPSGMTSALLPRFTSSILYEASAADQGLQRLGILGFWPVSAS